MIATYHKKVNLAAIIILFIITLVFSGTLQASHPYNPFVITVKDADIYDAVAVNKKYICTEPYPAFLDVAGPGTVIEDINTFQPEPDCEVNLYNFAVFALGWLSDGYYPK